LNVEQPSSPALPSKPSGNRIRNFITRERALVRFALVGASGVLVNEGVLYALTRFLKFPDIPAQAIGVELAIISNFLLNDRLTFASAPRHNSKLSRFAKYNLVSLITFSVNLIVFALLLAAKVFDIYASIIAIVAAFGLNYFGSSRWAWKAHKQSRSSAP
jgi:dolichol-phosphate mannosyltransferase